MNLDQPAVLDACVLLPMPLADTLFRMAENPGLYRPRWSQEIMTEVSRNLLEKWRKSPEQARRREDVLREHFPEAWVEGYASLIPAMGNDPKDRHVLVAAGYSKTKLIVTYNTRHFPRGSLERWGVEVQGPSKFLANLYDLEPGIVAQKLTEQAENVGITIEDLLRRLQSNVPGFVSVFCAGQAIRLTAHEEL